LNESPQDVKAYGLLAQAIAQFVFWLAERDPSRELYRAGFPEVTPPIFYHVSTSNLEAAARDLWRLGILRPLDQKGNWAFHFAFECEVGESNAVAERNRQHGPRFPELLTTFIDNFGELGTKNWGFSTKRDAAFGADSRIGRRSKRWPHWGIYGRRRLASFGQTLLPR
jgi:hypothetical protein